SRISENRHRENVNLAEARPQRRSPGFIIREVNVFREAAAGKQLSDVITCTSLRYLYCVYVPVRAFLKNFAFFTRGTTQQEESASVSFSPGGQRKSVKIKLKLIGRRTAGGPGGGGGCAATALMGNNSEPSALEGNEEIIKLDVSTEGLYDSSSSVSSDSAASQGSRVSHDFLANIGTSYVPSGSTYKAPSSRAFTGVCLFVCVRVRGTQWSVSRDTDRDDESPCESLTSLDADRKA
ncbi:hypothetical protein TSAR_010793, partial [Trichomalopsis sarcophagae]